MSHGAGDAVAQPILPDGHVQYIETDVGLDVYVTIRRSLRDKGFLGSPPPPKRLSVLGVRQDPSWQDLGPRDRQTECQGGGFGLDDQKICPILWQWPYSGLSDH